MNGKQRLTDLFLRTCASAFLLCALPICAEEEQSNGYFINFKEVPLVELIRFVSKISETNFIYNTDDLQFNVSLCSGKSVTGENVLKALVQLLKLHGFAVAKEQDYYVVHPYEEGQEIRDPFEEISEPPKGEMFASLDLVTPVAPIEPVAALPPPKEEYQFFVYKLKYHQGSEIEEAIKKIAGDLRSQPDAPVKLINAIHSLQWVKGTNSLLCSADDETLVHLRRLIDSLDIPLRQVFIEVLVVETDVKKGSEFGLQWASGGQFKERFGFGTGNFDPSGGNGKNTFAGMMKGIDANNTPTGLGQIPLIGGFDFGVIGDIIMHRGRSYLSLGSLVSAIEADADSTIVLNQKIITQDSKNSTIFVGDNIPFTGSVVQTVGQSQQTTANLEYRDVGVSLSITPMLGEGDIITLNLDEEITEVVDHIPTSNSTVNGIRTTKTNMATNVHVPDKHFLVLSGMVRNAKSHHKAGIPCLGSLPIIGSLFSKTKKQDEKRNVIIFVRPHIIRSFEDYNKITSAQEKVFELQANREDFQEAIDVLPPITPE